MKKAESPRIPFAEGIAAVSNEKAALMAANTKLGDENQELKEEVEELRVMMEILKGRRG
jgi:cell division protein FtsB